MQKKDIITISQAWSKSQNETQVSSMYKAISGDWGKMESTGTHVAFVGRVVYWSKTGSGNGDAEIPESKFRYFAELRTDDGTKNIWVEAGQSHVEVTAGANTRWELSGLFISQ